MDAECQKYNKYQCSGSKRGEGNITSCLDTRSDRAIWSTVCMWVTEGGADSILSRHQSGAAIKSPASAQGSNPSQSQQSSTGSQEEDLGQSASQEQIYLHYTYLHTQSPSGWWPWGSRCIIVRCIIWISMDIFKEWSTDQINKEMFCVINLNCKPSVTFSTSRTPRTF